jgi:DNA-binding MarR family transcriptional regulator
MADIVVPPREQFLREETIRGGMDLLLLANVRLLKRADERLSRNGLGRAHHRVLYVVARRPGMTVTEVLDVLGVVKQSYQRVSNDLLSKGLIEPRPDARDRRRRLAYLTEAGSKLEAELFAEIGRDFAHAYAASGGQAVAGFWTVLQNVIGPEGREHFRALQQR